MTDREILKIIGQNVRTARLKANMTQECLAELAGVHVQTISYIEQGKYPFAVTTFARIAQHLQTSSNRLLEGLAPPDTRSAERIKNALARKRKLRNSV